MTQDFFATASFAIVASETYARGVRHFLEDEMGAALHLLLRAQGRRQARQRGGPRGAAADKPPLVLFGCYNERMYLAELRRACDVHPGLVPGRHHPPRTPARPSWAMPARPISCRKYCNALFDALFHILPLGTDLDRVEATPARLESELPWNDERRRC